MIEEIGIPKSWESTTLETFLDYVQPTKYIVESTDYNDSYKTPVLTAGKSFLLGYTNETDGIFDLLPTIIFDDFTTAIKFVNFPFKVKSSAMKILVPTCELVNIRYVYYFMETLRLSADTHKRYWISEGAKVPIPVPPQLEQERIVSKIEELFSELDKGIETLKTAQQQLKVYRQAVLKYAFEGKLTNPDVKEGELPEGWTLKLIDELSQVIGGIAFKSTDFLESGKYQVIRMGNVRPGVIRYNESPVFLTQVEEKVLEKGLLKLKDIIITQTGTKGKRDYGFTVLIKAENLLLNQRIAAIRCHDYLLPEYLLYFTWTDYFKNQFFANETGNVGQGNVGIKGITKTLIPITSIEEQNKIIQEIESRLSVCDKIEESIEQGMQQAEALRQSILKKAFEGKLVPQDPNDEPASVLLERIKAERQKAQPENKTKTKKVKA